MTANPSLVIEETWATHKVGEGGERDMLTRPHIKAGNPHPHISYTSLCGVMLRGFQSLRCGVATFEEDDNGPGKGLAGPAQQSPPFGPRFDFCTARWDERAQRHLGNFSASAREVGHIIYA